MKSRTVCIAVLAVLSFELHSNAGGLATEATKAVGKAIGRKIGAEALEAGVKTGAKKLAKEIVEEGAEGAVRKAATTKGIGEVARLAAHTVPVKSLATAAVKHGVADGIKQISSQSARRMQMMAGEIQASGKGPEVLSLISKHAAGDKIVDFLWRNKATLAGGAIIATLIANPDAAIAAGTEIATETIHEAGESVAKPVIEQSIQHVVVPALNNFGIYSIIYIFAMMLIGSLVGYWLTAGVKKRIKQVASLFRYERPGMRFEIPVQPRP